MKHAFKNSFMIILTLMSLTFSAVTFTSARAASSIIANSSADMLADDGTCTLREAITNANSDSQLYATAGECAAGSGTDTITFAADYTITLVGSQLPAVTTTITINGAANTIIQADANPNTATYRVFEVTNTGNLILDSLTVQNGRCFSSCATNGNSGGGIYNAGALTASDVTFSANMANSGGGLYNFNSGSATLMNVTFSANSANSGGGLFNFNSNSATLTNVTFSANSASFGGGIFIYVSSPTLTNVTFSSNTASTSGGGMYNNGSNPTLTNVTFSSNTASNFGGGMYNNNGSNPTLTNTLIANSVSGGDCVNNVSTLSTLNAASSNNLIESTGSNACGLTSGTNGNIIGQDPNLSALADNGGTTQTYALLAGSLAIDAGTNTGCPATDQRGVTRPQSSLCDIGAYEVEEPTQPGPDFVVNTSADTNDGYCDLLGQGTGNQDCTLREAINAANAVSDASEITFAANYTITLAGSQLPVVTTTISIDGNGAANTLLQANASPNTATNRVLEVNNTGNLTIKDLTVRNGQCNGACPTGASVGGGIYNVGTLTVTNSTLSTNSAAIFAGGIFNNNGGTLTVTNSTFSANSASQGGGGIFNFNGSTVSVINSTFSANSAYGGGGISNANSAILIVTNSMFFNNSATYDGGGIYNDGTLTVTNSTFSANSTTNDGGGIYNDGTSIVTNSTFSANSATNFGGGIVNGGTLTVTNNTFSTNSATAGGSGMLTAFGTTTLYNTIMANSLSGINCVQFSGTVINADSANVDTDGSCNNATQMTSAQINLQSLTNNGGTTLTMALGTGSVAIDMGDDANCSSTDQRGVTRPQGSHCDIGAYEYVDTTAPSVTVFTVSPATGLNIPITTFTALDDAIIAGYLITESATPPTLGDAGWTASAPTTYPVASMGSYTLYPWAKDAAGNVSAVYGSGVTVNITCFNSITVTSNADSGPGTLRQALADACVGDINNISMINFASALSGDTIHLASELTIAKNVTIDGSALASKINLSGDSDNNGTGDVRVFSITGGSPGLTVTLDSLIVTKGVTSGHGAGLFMEQGMHVTITNSIFSDNHAGGRGGGIGNQGVLTLINSTVSGNSAASTNGGGGISNESGLTMTNSTISNNSATGATASGGGLFNTGGATITNSTIFGNSSNVYGGGISTTANLTITNSTIAGNSAYATGGLQVDGNVTHLRNTIIANNTSTIINSLIHNDCSDTSDYPAAPSADGDGIVTNVNNLIEDGSCSPSLSGDPNLGPLADNGGLTQTVALLAGSDAIDAGDDTICAGAYHPATNPNPVNSLDQRGAVRPNSAHCDIGAYEYADASIPTVTAFTVPSPANSLNIPITTFTASDDATVAGYLITQSSTPPSAFAVGWTASLPSTYTVASGGSYILYPWAKDAVNNVSTVFGSPASVSVDTTKPTVTSFTATSPSASLNIPITAFTASDAIGVTGYLITSSATPPSVGAAGWTASVLSTYTVGSDGSYTLYPWAKDAADNVSAVFATPCAVTVDTSIPSVNSINRANANPTNLDSVGFTVTFSESVMGVEASDFTLTKTGMTGAVITNVSGSGTTRTVTVNTGSGNGTIRLDLVDNDSIKDITNNPLGGVGGGNGNYTGGETYTVNSIDTTGVFRPTNGLLYLKYSNTTGFADVAINYGLGGDYPVVGDWDGNGLATIGIYRNGSFYLRNSNTLGFADLVFAFGIPGDQPVAGDWNGDGTDTIGIYRPSTGQFLLRNSNSSGLADMSFYLGNVGDVGIAGDWNGDGIDTTGVFRPTNGVIFLKDTNTTGFAYVALNYGLPGDQPVTGDWNGDGIDTIGVYRNGQFLLRNSNTLGFADLVFRLGNPDDMPIAGDWDGMP